MPNSENEQPVEGPGGQDGANDSPPVGGDGDQDGANDSPPVGGDGDQDGANNSPPVGGAGDPAEEVAVALLDEEPPTTPERPWFVYNHQERVPQHRCRGWVLWFIRLIFAFAGTFVLIHNLLLSIDSLQVHENEGSQNRTNGTKTEEGRGLLGYFCPKPQGHGRDSVGCILSEFWIVILNLVVAFCLIPTLFCGDLRALLPTCCLGAGARERGRRRLDDVWGDGDSDEESPPTPPSPVPGGDPRFRDFRRYLWRQRPQPLGGGAEGSGGPGEQLSLEEFMVQQTQHRAVGLVSPPPYTGGPPPPYTEALPAYTGPAGGGPPHQGEDGDEGPDSQLTEADASGRTAEEHERRAM